MNLSLPCFRPVSRPCHPFVVRFALHMFFRSSADMPVHFCISCRLLWALVPTLDQKKPEIIGFNTRRGLTHLSKGRRLAPRGGISVKSTKKRFLDGCLACLMNSCILIFPNQIRKGVNHDQEENPGLRPSQTYSRGIQFHSPPIPQGWIFGIFGPTGDPFIPLPCPGFRSKRPFLLFL